MTYQTSHRIAALSFIKEGGSKVEAARIFKVSRHTLYRWLDLEDVEPKPPPSSRHRKIDKAALARHVEEHDDMFLRERAAIFGVHISSMGRALKKLKISKKNSVDTQRDAL